jgi:hypothetical protein
MDRSPQFGWLVICYRQGKAFVFCIVILALILIPSSFVALKILVADLSDADREIRILKFLADKSTSDSEGLQHILTLKDNFQIEGPNGTHHVLVTEVLAPLAEFKYHGIYRKVR